MKSKNQKYVEAISRNIKSMLAEKRKIYNATRKAVLQNNYDAKLANEEISFANSLYANYMHVGRKVGLRKRDIDALRFEDFYSFSVHDYANFEFKDLSNQFKDLTSKMSFFKILPTPKAAKS